MANITSVETMTNNVFELFVESNGVVQHNHSDNCCFDDNALITTFEKNKQHITCSGVIAHFKIGIVQWTNQDNQEQVQKQLLHAWARWSEVRDLSLCPYALKYNVYICNTLSSQDDNYFRLELFAGNAEQKWNKIHFWLPSDCPEKWSQGRHHDFKMVYLF